MEQRLIDAVSLRKAVNDFYDNSFEGIVSSDLIKYAEAVDDIIDNAPTIDTTFREVVAYECGQKSVEERPKSEWIPVSKKLPNKGGTYLLWGKLTDTEDCYCFIGDYDEGCEQFGYWEQQYDPNTLGCLGEDFFKYDCVIAWMPLPEPYTRGDV